MQLPILPDQPKVTAPGSAEREVERLPLSPREEAIVVAIATAAMPQGNVIDGGSEATITRLARYFAGAPGSHLTGLRGLLWSCELATLPTLATLPRSGRPSSSPSTKTSRLNDTVRATSECFEALDESES